MGKNLKNSSIFWNLARLQVYMALIFTALSYGIRGGQVIAGEGTPGPEMVADYGDWSPGDGPLGPHCLLFGVDINVLTGFEGAFVMTGCDTARAGEFWSRLFLAVFTPEQREVLLADAERFGDEWRRILIVDEGTKWESTYSISIWKSFVRNADGTVRIYQASDLNLTPSNSDLCWQWFPFLRNPLVFTHFIHWYNFQMEVSGIKARVLGRL